MPELVESFLIISAQVLEGVRKSRNGRGQEEPLISIRFVWHGEDDICETKVRESRCYMPSSTG